MNSAGYSENSILNKTLQDILKSIPTTELWAKQNEIREINNAIKSKNLFCKKSAIKKYEKYL